MAFFRSLLRSYNVLLELHPYKTTALTTGILCSTGDILAQQVVERKQKHDVFRTLKYFSMGVFFIGPGLRTWYGVLERSVRGTGRSVAVKKMLLDQTLFAPSFIATFFCLSDVLGGKSFEGVKRNLHENYFSTLKMNYVIWPTVQLVNFYFTPLNHRVIVVNIVALFWNTYLAWAVNKSDKIEEV